MQNGIRLGNAFAFFVPELAQSFGWLSNLMGGSAPRKVFSLLGPTPLELPGAQHLTVLPPALQLNCVTSDKALYSYVKTLGASILRAHEWNALERRVTPPAPEGGEKPDRETDVDGWLKRFGGD